MEISEKCGIFGVFGSGFEAARLVHPGLWALQHRGQESSGIASTDGKTIMVHKRMGLVASVYKEADFEKLLGESAIGHNRYATSKGSNIRHAQPIVAGSGLFALAHNGNLPETTKLEAFLKQNGVTKNGKNDSEMIMAAFYFFFC